MFRPKEATIALQEIIVVLRGVGVSQQLPTIRYFMTPLLPSEDARTEYTHLKKRRCIKTAVQKMPGVLATNDIENKLARNDTEQ